MSRTSMFVCTVAVSLGLSGVLACGVQTPLAPKPTGGNSSGTAADGTTLKVGAPTLVSPINDTSVTVQRPVLTISPATAQFTSAPANLQYEFELQNDAGAVITRATVSGTTYTLQADAGTNVAYRWRARAVSGAAFGPFSGVGRFLSPRLAVPGVGASYDEFRAYFFALVAQRNAGPNVSIAGLQLMEPDLTAAQVLIQRTSANTLRPRLYLPTGNPSRLYDRTVDLGELDRPWQWIVRGSTTCEGAGCK
jgi:hypothetical protein